LGACFLFTSIYRITGNFCGFGLKRRHLIFADFYFCGYKEIKRNRKHSKQFVYCFAVNMARFGNTNEFTYIFSLSPE
jgi:hypothetical protein